EHQLKFHLDGARLWNALVVKRDNPKTYGTLFDTISVCLSKGLGAPVGSLLVSDAETIQRALRIRKVLGGGMRQAGYLAAAGLYALDHHVARLAEDHRRAREIATVLDTVNWVAKVEPVETNIVIFSLANGLDETKFLQLLKERNIHISSLGKGKLRIVTHLDYKQVMHDYVLETFKRISIRSNPV
ncbi:MAG TPA: beta-eliminating lyase-related protein, partial [Flavobacterium sp.]|nr:beta-eliminating lyase-related protein [Flavobacterium sp.]